MTYLFLSRPVDVLVAYFCTWIVFSLSTLGGLALLQQFIRPPNYHCGRAICPQCNYSLKGVADHRCPECGRPFTLEELGIKESDLAPTAPQQVDR